MSGRRTKVKKKNTIKKGAATAKSTPSPKPKSKRQLGRKRSNNSSRTVQGKTLPKSKSNTKIKNSNKNAKLKKNQSKNGNNKSSTKDLAITTSGQLKQSKSKGKKGAKKGKNVNKSKSMSRVASTNATKSKSRTRSTDFFRNYWQTKPAPAQGSQFASEEKYASVPPDIFKNTQEPVDDKPLMTDYAIAGTYMSYTYDGSKFLEDLESVADLVYDDDTGECAADLEDAFLWCKLRHICQRNGREKSRFEFHSQMPDYATGENFTKSNMFVRLLFPKNKAFEDGILVFQIEFNEYNTEFQDSAQLIWDDIQESEFDLDSIPMDGFEEVAKNVEMGYEIDPRVAWRFLDYNPKEYTFYVNEHNKKFNKTKKIRKRTVNVSNTPKRNKTKTKSKSQARTQQNRSTNSNSTKSKNSRTKSLTGAKRTRAQRSDTENDDDNDTSDDNNDKGDKSSQEESQDNDVNPQYNPPPKKKPRKNSKPPPLAMQLRSSTKEKRKQTEEKLQKKRLATRGRARGRGRSSGRGRGKGTGHDNSGTGHGNNTNSVSNGSGRGIGGRSNRAATQPQRRRHGLRQTSIEHYAKQQQTNDSQSEGDSVETESESATISDKDTNNSSNASNHDNDNNTDDEDNDDNNTLDEADAQDNEHKDIVESSTLTGADSSELSAEEESPEILFVPTVKGKRRRKKPIQIENSDDSNDADNEENNNINDNENDENDENDQNEQNEPNDNNDENEEKNNINDNENDTNESPSNMDVDGSTGQIASVDDDDPVAQLSRLGLPEANAISNRRNNNQNSKPPPSSKSKKKKSKTIETNDVNTSDYTDSSDEEEIEQDKTLGYVCEDADELAISFISKEEFDIHEGRRKLTVFVSGTHMGVDPRTYSPLARTSLYGHRSGYACLLQKGLWFPNELNNKVLDLTIGDIQIKIILNNNYTPLTRFCLHLKRKVCGRWKGVPPKPNAKGEIEEKFLQFNTIDLVKCGSYFNVSSFGGKTGGASSSGWKRVRELPIFIGPVWIWLLDLQGEDYAIKRIAREIFYKNGRYDVKPIHVFNQLRNIKAQPSVIKHLSYLIYNVLLQILCGVINLIDSGGINCKNLKRDYSFQWPLLPTLVDPTIATLRLATKESKTKTTVTELIEEEFFPDARAFFRYKREIKAEVNKVVKEYFTTNKNALKRQSKPKFFGLKQKLYNYYFKKDKKTQKDNICDLKISQADLADQIPRFTQRCQYCKINQADLAAMKLRPPTDTNYVIFKPGYRDIKFNKPYPLANGANDLQGDPADIGNIRYVEMGGMGANEDCIRILQYFYRSISNYIDTPPYIPDFTLKIGAIHGTRIKPNYRLLFYGFASYLKLNVVLLPHDTQARQEITKNTRDKWYSKQLLSLKLLNQIFYQDSEGAEKKFMKLSLNGGDKIIKFLRKDENLTSRDCWLLRAMQSVTNAHHEYAGWSCMGLRWGPWRDAEMPRPPQALNSHDHEWMFNLIHTIKPNECLLTLKAIQVIATRITSLLVCDINSRQEEDGAFYVKCILSMLDLASKGDINKWHQTLMPIVTENLQLFDDRNVKQCLNILNYTTISISECLRAVSKLSDFDFNWVIRNKYVHQMWLTYFYAVIIALIDYIRLFESGLDDLCNYLQYAQEHNLLLQEFRRYENFLNIIFVKFQCAPAPPTAGTQAQLLYEFSKYSREHPTEPMWTLESMQAQQQQVHQWFEAEQKKIAIAKNRQRVQFSNQRQSGSRESRSPSLSRSPSSKSRTKSNSPTKSASQSEMSHDNDNDKKSDDEDGGGGGSSKHTVSHPIPMNNNNNDNSNNNDNTNDDDGNNTDHVEDNDDDNTNENNQKQQMDENTQAVDEKIVIDNHDANSSTNDSSKVINDENDKTGTQDSELAMLNANDNSIIVDINNIINDNHSLEDGEIREDHLSFDSLLISHQKQNSNSPIPPKNRVLNKYGKSRRQKTNNKSRSNSNSASNTGNKSNTNVNKSSNSNGLGDKDAQVPYDEQSYDNFELECVEQINGDGDTVYNNSNKNIEILHVRCYEAPDLTNPCDPIDCIHWDYNTDRGTYDYFDEYQPNNITNTTGNIGILTFDQDHTVFFCGSSKQRKQWIVNIPNRTKMHASGECAWLARPFGAPASEAKPMLNRLFSGLPTPPYVFKKHRVNTKEFPCRYGQTVMIERLGRSWKGKYPFDIFGEEYIYRHEYTNQDNGRWTAKITLDLDPTHKINGKSWGYFVELESMQLRVIKDAPADFKLIPKCPDVHRPSSLMRFLLLLAKENPKIDVEYCNNWITEYNQRKKNQSPLVLNKVDKDKDKDKHKDKDKEKSQAPSSTSEKKKKKSSKNEIDNE